MNDFNEVLTDKTDSKKFLDKQAKFGFTVRNKSFQNRKLKNALDDYLKGFDIELPEKKQDFERYRGDIFNYDAYGDSLEQKLEEIVKLRYAVANTKGYYAMFTENGQKVLQPLAFWYSRHRLCSVWNWRKSQIIRKRYKYFLENATDGHGRLLINHYLPIHLVLTVPHENGNFKGQRFYAKHLIEAFTAMRKTEIWKKYIYAGEYGIEVKKSEKHGLHIHIHSFLLQNPEFTVVETQQELSQLWKIYTDNDSDFSGLHYETLYTWKKDEKGKIAMEEKEVYDRATNSKIIKKVPVKDYINPDDADVNRYLSGVLECIKYHFKPDCLQTENGGFDMELIEEILNNTKGKRLYSRFGKFYSVKELNFNNIEKEVEDVATDEETENDLKTSTDGVEERVISPFTGEKSKRDDYKIVITNPLFVKYKPKTDVKPLENYVYTTQLMKIASDSLTLKQVLKLDLMGFDVTAFSQDKIELKDFKEVIYVPMVRDTIEQERLRLEKENEFLNKEISGFFDFTGFAKIGEAEEINEFEYSDNVPF